MNRFQGFDSAIAYVAWRAGTDTQESIPRNRFLGSLNVLQIRPQISWALTYHLTSKGIIVYRVIVFLCCLLIWGHPPPTHAASELYVYTQGVERQRGGSHFAREMGGGGANHTTA
jgi:hypothetical protein